MADTETELNIYL